MGHLARQRLPAGQLAEIHQPLGAFLQLAGHAVEGLDGAADFVVALGLDAGVQVARCELGETGSQLLDGTAHAMRQVNQQRQ